MTVPQAAPPAQTPSRWVVYLLVFGLYLTLRGYQSREGDQAYRLPILLHGQAPALFADDPFVSAFDDFNPHRGSLALLDGLSRPCGLSAALATLYVLTFLATCLGIDRLARAAWPGRGSRVGLVAIGLLLVARAGNVGTNHLFEAMLLDRLIGFGLGWLAFAAALADPERGWKWAAPAIAAAGFVHPSVGLQLAMVLASAWVAWALLGEASWKSAARGAVALGLAVLPGLAMNLGEGGRLLRGLPLEEFRLLSVELQGPQHMLPHLWRRPQWIAWGCYAVLALLALADPDRGAAGSGTDRPPARRRLAILLAVTLAGLGAAWFAVEVVQDLRITLFQPFRMATVARGLALVAVSGRVLALWRRGDLAGRARAAVIAVGLAGDRALIVATLFELSLSLVEAYPVGSSAWAVSLSFPRSAWECRLRRSAALPFQAAWCVSRTLRGFAPWAWPPRSLLDAGLSTLPSSTTEGLHPPCRVRETHHHHLSRWCVSRTLQGPPGSGVAAALAGGGVLAAGLRSLALHDTESGHLPLLGALAVAAASTAVGRSRPIAWTPRRLATALALAWTIPLAALAVQLGPFGDPTRGPSWTRGLVAHCRFAEVPIDDLERLAVWCRERTPASARFIGPPGPKTFRLWSRRSLAFNRAGSPYHAEALADWAARFRDHVDFPGSTADLVRAYLADRHALERRYQAMTDPRRAALALRQGATHVIAAPPPRGATADPEGPLEWLHTEGRYAVYRVRPPTRLASRFLVAPARSAPKRNSAMMRPLATHGGPSS